MGRCKDERISDYLNALASFFLLNFVVSCSWPTELKALALGLDVACVLRRISAYHVCKEWSFNQVRSLSLTVLPM